MQMHVQARRMIQTAALLAVLVLPGAGTYFALQSAQQQVKKAVKHAIVHGMDRSELQILRFTKEQLSTELDWEHAGEFAYRGHMYDIVHQEWHGNQVTYWCWRDDAESIIRNQLQSLAARTAGNNGDDDISYLISFFHHLVCPHPEIDDAEFGPLHNVLKSSDHNLASQHISDPDDKPPQHV